MGFSKLCPICRLNKIFLRQVHTCGAPSCLKTWKELSPEARVKFNEAASEATELPVGSVEETLEWLKSASTGKAPTDKLAENSPFDEILKGGKNES